MINYVNITININQRYCGYAELNQFTHLKIKLATILRGGSFDFNISTCRLLMNSIFLYSNYYKLSNYTKSHDAIRIYVSVRHASFIS